VIRAWQQSMYSSAAAVPPASTPPAQLKRSPIPGGWGGVVTRRAPASIPRRWHTRHRPRRYRVRQGRADGLHAGCATWFERQGTERSPRDNGRVPRAARRSPQPVAYGWNADLGLFLPKRARCFGHQSWHRRMDVTPELAPSSTSCTFARYRTGMDRFAQHSPFVQSGGLAP